jgi:hypothetical protein
VEGSGLNRILIFADLDHRLTDGSAIWLKNFAGALADAAPQLNVVVLLKFVRNEGYGADADVERHLNVQSDTVADALASRRNISIVTPREIQVHCGRVRDQIGPSEIKDSIESVEKLFGPVSSIVCRGYSACIELLKSERTRSRTVVYWAYLERTEYHLNDRLLELCRVQNSLVLVQSWPAKTYLEVFGQLQAHRVAVVPPIVDQAFAVAATDRRFDPRSIRLCYFGKIDRDYGIETLIRLAEVGGLSVTIFEGKLTRPEDDPGFINRYLDLLHRHRDVSVVRAVPHLELPERLKGFHFSYSLRSSKYESSFEVSTKLLESCSLGLPPLLSDTSANRAVFGSDYPLYFRIESPTVKEEIASRLKSFTRETYSAVQAWCLDVARSLQERQVSSLRRLIPPARGRDWGRERKRVLIASHDNKFLERVLPEFDRAILELEFDHWLSTEEPSVAREQFSWDGDVIFCEWCCGQAVWFSRNKRAGQKLIVRLHRFEMFGKHVQQVNWDAVDVLIVVNHQFKDDLVDRFGIDPEIIRVFPQYICSDELDRPKHSHSDYAIGFVGINPFHHKRFDIAVDMIERLRDIDPRYTLRVRSAMPWDIGWLWSGRPDERRLYQELFMGIESRKLWDRITFDDAGVDMEEWYRNVDIILSTSETEGCHTAVMEGVASGAMPVVFDWPGAIGLFPDRYIVDSIEAAVDLVCGSYVPGKGARPELKREMAQYDYKCFVDLLTGLIWEASGVK